MDILWFLIIGAVAGWAAGRVVRGGGFGLIGNVVVGVIGGVLGGWVFGLLGVSAEGGSIGSFVTAFIGAALLLVALSTLKKKS